MALPASETVRLYSPAMPARDLAEAPSSSATSKPAGLSVTALYTAETWRWGKLPCSELLASDDGRTVFRVTNFALAVARVFSWKLRSLKHSLLHRHTMIDHLLRAAGPVQVLELAAGLSRRGATFSDDPAVRYTEVDLPPVVARKRALLERTEAGRAVTARSNLRLVEGDVLDLDLTPLSDPARPLFVIAEGLLMYLTPDQQRAIWTKVRALIDSAPDGGTRGGHLVFDLIPACEEPKPGPIGRALAWLMKRFTSGQGFERDARTRDDIARELKQAGFDEVELFEPAAVAHSWALPFPAVRTQQLLFVAKVHQAREQAT